MLLGPDAPKRNKSKPQESTGFTLYVKPPIRGKIIWGAMYVAGLAILERPLQENLGPYPACLCDPGWL